MVKFCISRLKMSMRYQDLKLWPTGMVNDRNNRHKTKPTWILTHLQLSSYRPRLYKKQFELNQNTNYGMSEH